MQKHRKGFARLNPIKNKYQSIWDIDRLYRFIDSGELDTFYGSALGKCRRMKTFLLIQMSCAGRAKDIYNIDRPTLEWGEDFVRFRYNDWKTKGVEGTALSKRFEIRKTDNARICAFSALKDYMAFYADKYPPEEEFPFIWLTYNGKPMTSEKHPFSKDIKSVLAKIGLSTGGSDSYHPNSIRHAVISKWSRGCSLEQVIERTGHRGTETVRKFYDLSVHQDISKEMLDSNFPNTVEPTPSSSSEEEVLSSNEER